jgi:nucleoside-diphosphate kinase
MFFMVVERTLSIIKPDGVAKNIIGEILSRFEKIGLKIVAAKMLRMTRMQAEEFYFVHRERDFYQGLVDFMISGPVLVLVLEGENAIQGNRRITGATNPKEAESGTIRADFADSIDLNVVHGSDAPETAVEEIRFFFKPDEIYSR